VSVLDLFVCSISNYPVWLPIPRALREQVRLCLERVHAEDLIDKRVGMLSGGEMQRMLLAMALEPLPQILILDEPFSGVDVEAERQLYELLDEVRTNYDLSILLCTHDFTTLSLMDKVLLLRKELLKSGTPEEVTASEEFQNLFSVTGRKGGAK
jgi:zinc transport system ATP-binding protein